MIARRYPWLLVSLVLLGTALSRPANAQPLLGARSVAVGLLTCQLPDSIRTKIFVSLAAKSAFNLANRQMGRCKQVAEAIYTAFREFGVKPEYVRVFSTGEEKVRFLSWQSRVIMSDNNLHFAVRHNGRVYDSFTGSEGMLEAEYRAAIHAHGVLNIVFTEAL